MKNIQISPEDCVTEFATRKRAWVWIASLAAVCLLLSIITFSTHGGVQVFQMAGLVMLSAFVAASAVLCRCPRCDKFLLNKKELVPDWNLKRCPHCDATLQGRK
jgi:hypothetical protein